MSKHYKYCAYELNKDYECTCHMKQPKVSFTPGEWLLNPLPNPKSPEYYCLYVKPGDPSTVEHIALITSRDLNNKDAVHGNAKLLVKSKAMYEALKRVVKLNIAMPVTLSDDIQSILKEIE